MGTDDEIVREIFTLMKAHPNSWKDKLSNKAKKRLRKQVIEQKIRQNVEIIKYLNLKKIEYVILKGISLWYFDHGRDFEDIDILVDRKDAENVANLFINDFGYSFERPEQLDFLRNPKQNHDHDISMIAPKKMPIEIHYRMFNYLDQHNLDLISDKVFLELEGTSIPCQSKELQLLEAFLHNIYHHFLICDRKKWANDLRIILENYDIDWDRFLGFVEELEQKEVVYLTGRMLDVKLPPSIINRLRPKSPLGYLKKPVFIWTAYFVRDRLFPPKGILVQRFRIKPDSIFFILAYPANWARLALSVIGMAVKKIIGR